jgi:hypothetical protein
VALGASVIGNGLWNAASRLLPLSLSGQLIVFETLFALIYGFLHDARWPLPLEAAAIVLMLAGCCGRCTCIGRTRRRIRRGRRRASFEARCAGASG